MSTDLLVRDVPGKGRGVFAGRNFAAGELIEREYVIILPDDQCELLEKTNLKDYYFAWGENSSAIPLGFSLLYNHSEHPNAQTIRYLEQNIIEFIAIRDIQMGEEITYTYSCPLWFHNEEQTYPAMYH